MKKRSLTSLLTIILLLSATTGFARKNEVIYANLSNAGEVEGVYIVNRFEAERQTDVIDYGAYKSVVNLTDMSPIKQSGDEMSFTMPSGAFFYQGNAVSLDIPWLFSIKYKLDGSDIAPGDIAGKSGNVEISVSLRKNDKVNALFFDNYLLSMSVTLDGDTFTDVKASDATVANSGKDKLLTYTVLPGNEKEYIITAVAAKFEMGTISINGVPFGLDIGEIDTSEIKDKLGDMQVGISSVNKGADKIKKASQKLFEGTNELYSGSVAISGGISDISAGSSQLESASGKMLSGINQLCGALTQLQQQAEKLKNGGTELSKGAKSLAENVKALETGLNQIKEGSSSVASSIGMLSQMAGGCDDEIKLVNALLAKGAQNADVKTYLSKEMAAMTKIIKTLKGVDSGLGALNDSYTAINAGIAQAAAGAAQLSTACDTLSQSIEAYSSGVGKMLDAINGVDASAFAKQFEQFDEGVKSLNAAISTLKSSYAKLNEGIKSIYNGADQLQGGAKKLDSGTGELKNKTRNMDQKVDDEVDETLAKYTGDDFTPVSFTDSRNEVELVQFVIKTESIEIPQADATEDDTARENGSFIDTLLALFK